MPSLQGATDGRLDGEQDSNKQDLTTSATTILDGMVKAFLERPAFPEDELRCRGEHIDILAKDVMKASEQTAFFLSATLDSPCDSRGCTESQPRVDPKANDSRPVANISNSLVTIIRLQGLLADECMQGRSLDTFNLAEDHLRNLSYVGGHLVANGADIIPELKDALGAFRNGKLHTFGEDIGRAWRKVLLSNVSNLPRIKEAIRQTSQGLVEGFFSENVQLEVSSGKEQRGQDFHNAQVDTLIDLHKCINGQNERFFQEVWDAAWLFFEKVSSFSSLVSDQRWKAVLAVVLADLPTAVRYCGLDKEQEALLIHSMKKLEKLRFDVDARDRKVHTSEVSVDLAQAVHNWRNHSWHDFGMDLGKLLQELVVLVFPADYSQKYRVSETVRGALRNRFSGAPSGAVQLPLGLLAAGAVVSFIIFWAFARRGARDPPCEALALSDLELDVDSEGIE
jgi:hypothetical protein